MTKYIHNNPTTRRWAAEQYDSRDEAALAYLRKYPLMKGGHTAPVLAVVNGVVLPEHNSVVHFLDICEAGAAEPVLRHDARMLREARVR